MDDVEALAYKNTLPCLTTSYASLKINKKQSIAKMASIFFFLSLLSLFSSFNKGFGFEENELIANKDKFVHTHVIQLSSLLSSSVCSPPIKALDKKISLEVTHKHGPCSKHINLQVPTHSEILRRDQDRVNSIHSRFGKRSTKGATKDDIEQTDAANLPVKDGKTIGSPNYIVTIGLGSPKRDLSLIFDTGSDLTWTQCKPCAKSCYEQKDPIFDPSTSTSYYNVTCGTPTCKSLYSATGNALSCAGTTCTYGIQYGDSSFSVGNFATETLTLTSTDLFKNFLFGCGQNNQGLFSGSAGLIGLGRDPLSLPSQTSSKYNKLFSYCLPSTPSGTGHLTFGTTLSKTIKYTPLSSISQGTSFYGLDVTGITVGGQKLAISNSIFSNSGTIIDSGTIITRLPATAYSALRTSFREKMTQYPRAPALSILDTCYDLSKFTTITIPKISFFYNGGVEVVLAGNGILYAGSVSQVCLAFAGNSGDNGVAIFGNVQQKTLEVVYDGANGKVGFGQGGCS